MTDDELRQLQEDAGWLEDLIASPGWNVLQRRYLEKMATEQRAIIQGRCKDFEEYKARVAFTDGMEFVLGIPKNTIDLMETTVRAKLERESHEQSG